MVRCWLAPYKIHPRASLRIFPPAACLGWTGTPVSDFHVQLRECANCGPRPLPHVGDLQPNEGRASIFSKKTNTLNPSGIYLWGPALGDPWRPRLSRQMDEFLIFIVILKQNVAIMSSLWGSPNGIRLWRPASWGPTAAAPEPPNGRIPCIYRYFRTTCRHNVELMRFPEWYSPLGTGFLGIHGGSA